MIECQHFYKRIKVSLHLILRKLCFVFLGVLLVTSPDSYADNNFEYKLKAAYLINLGDFIVWQGANKNAQGSFSICIATDDPVNAYLQQTAQHLVKGKSLKIVNTLTLEQLKQCHIVYAESEKFLQILKVSPDLIDESVLTVSSEPGFVGRGGNIEFFIRDNKVRMRIDLNVSRKSRLTVSSKLLRLMEVINP